MKSSTFIIIAICRWIYKLQQRGCSDVPPIDPDEARPHAKTNRTVLAYLVGDMSLWYALEETVNQMGKRLG